MEWFRIRTSSLLIRVAVDEIVYVRADGNYCDLVLINGRSRKLTFQLKYFDENFQLLKSADMFMRVGRSLIVNRAYVQAVDLMDQTITFGGKHLMREAGGGAGAGRDVYVVKVAREALKKFKEQLENTSAAEKS